MDIEEFKTYCLSFEGAYEKMPFGRASSDYDRNMLVFCVGDKWFCFVNAEVFDFCTVKCDPAKAEELKERYDGGRPGYHVNKKHWVSVLFGGDVPDDAIRELVRASYETVVASLPKNRKMEDLSCYNPEGSDRRKVQRKMLSILDTVMAIFERHGIPCWLDGGTLLGAVRHGGFIPWDDDIDVDVPAALFPKAKEVLRAELPADLYLQTRGGGYRNRWIKVKDRYSVLDEPESRGLEHRGIFIDIFPARPVGRREQALKSRIDKRIRRCREAGKTAGRRFWQVLYRIVTPLFLFERKTLFVTDDLFVRWAFPLALLEPLGTVRFEGKEYPAPNDPDLYLRIHYGDYLRIPEEKDRAMHAVRVTFLEKKGKVSGEKS